MRVTFYQKYENNMGKPAEKQIDIYYENNTAAVTFKITDPEFVSNAFHTITFKKKQLLELRDSLNIMLEGL